MIRESTGTDLDAIVDIWLLASFGAHDFIPRAYWENKKEDMKNIYLPSSETWVYEDDSTSEICGFLSLKDTYLAALFVLPGKQRKGIGCRLMQAAKSMRKQLRLQVYAENERAVRFYTKQGFRITGDQVDTDTGRKEYWMEF